MNLKATFIILSISAIGLITGAFAPFDVPSKQRYAPSLNGAPAQLRP